ncbi:hypothetical protein GCM10023091_01130 [Ravibacter arvi]|uniref:Antitoxin Xre/MbcA/ParS-like toxin-binding domain-containing protein n=1 Tax=Ravibacter arvi TaxID=2051041 RepID=A0ABP8LL88_9BACT
MMDVLEKESLLDKEIGKLLRKTGRSGANSGRGYVKFSEVLTDKMSMVFLIRNGIPYHVFELIRESGPLTENEWAAILDVSSKTLTRYKTENRDFKTLLAEKIMEMAEVTQLGLEVFGNLSRFSQWLHTPSFALGNLMPLELLKDSYGKELVTAELSHIHYGIFV